MIGLPSYLLLKLMEGGDLNCLSLLDRLSNCSDPAYGAALFHQQFIQGLVQWVGQHSEVRGIKKIVLSGGCFLNQLLLTEVKSGLQKEKLDVFFAVKMPCNDGAISLGQAQIALEIEYQKLPTQTTSWICAET